MTTHTIKAVDWHHGSEYRDIIWDDETGAVSGDHYEVQTIKEILREPKPLKINRVGGYWELPDAAHVPVQFMAVVVVSLEAQLREAILSPELAKAENHLFDAPHFIEHPSLPPGSLGA